MRRSKRSASILSTNQVGNRRSKRKEEAQLSDDKIYGQDYGILPSD